MLLAALVVASCALMFSSSRARAETGLEAGLGLGYGAPFGKVADQGGDLGDGITGQVPIWIDLGYRVLDPLFVGLYVQYGLGFVGDQFDPMCDLDGVDCAASDTRLGLEVRYHIRPGASLDPWVGVGAGYEWLDIALQGSGVELDTTTSGFEFINFQVGLDIESIDHLALGPFLSFSLGRYDRVSATCSGPPSACSMIGAIDGDIAEKAMHEWLVLGVRGAYVP